MSQKTFTITASVIFGVVALFARVHGSTKLPNLSPCPVRYRIL